MSGVRGDLSGGGVMNKIIMELECSCGKCLWRWRNKFRILGTLLEININPIIDEFLNSVLNLVLSVIS
jgi:hypothetical protein